MSEEKRKFLALHMFHFVKEWEWQWDHTLLRAASPGRNYQCFITDTGIRELLDEGLMLSKWNGSFEVTDAGRRAWYRG